MDEAKGKEEEFAKFMAAHKKTSDRLTELALQEIEESPLTDEIMAQAPPPKFVIPKINVYNGTAGPTDHLLHYRNIMALNTSEDYLMCRVFPASLHGQALVWFHKIPAK